MAGTSSKESLDEALVAAADDGDVDKVSELLSQGARVDTKDEYGDTPLLAAASFGHTEVCELLLDRGKANIEETGSDGNTALHVAANEGSARTVSLLLSKGAKVDTKNRNGFTPLLAAAQEDHTDVCELLLANSSDLEEKEPRTQNTALHFAAGYGHQSFLQLLLSHKADVNSRNRIESTPLVAASQEGHLASVATLLQAGADPLLPQVDGGLPIHLAAQKNQSGVVRILIEHGGCSPDQVRHTALQAIDNLSK